MATQTIAQQDAVILAFPEPKTETISQGLLAGLIALRREREALDAQISETEETIRMALTAGAAVEAGPFRAYLKTSERRNVAWREIVERELGAGYASNVLSHTKPTVSTRLVVEA